MNLIALFQIIAFHFYLVYLWVKFKGPLPSISDSWYALEKDKKAHYFNWFTALVGIPLWLYGAYTGHYRECVEVILVGSGFALFCVGIASQFRMKSVDRIHYAGAVLAIGLGFLAIILQYQAWVLLGIFIALAIILKLLKIRNYTWWVEVIAFEFVIGRLLML